MLAKIENIYLSSLIFASVYVMVRAAVFYTFFYALYQWLKYKKGIVKNLPSIKQLKTERNANITANIFEIIVIFLVLSSDIIIFKPLTVSSFIFSFIFCYLFFELWFYTSHRLLHTKWFSFFHHTHHVSVITTPLSALTLSIGEKLINDFGLLIIPCLLTQWLPLSFEGIMAYHLYNFYINVMGHSNLELMPRWFVKSFLGKIFVTSTYHSLHHLKGNCHYGLFLTFMDKLFGTTNPQYQDYYDHVTKVGSFHRNLKIPSKHHE